MLVWSTWFCRFDPCLALWARTLTDFCRHLIVGVNAERTTSPNLTAHQDEPRGRLIAPAVLTTVLAVFSILSPQLIYRFLERSVYDVFASWEVKQLCAYCNKE